MVEVIIGVIGFAIIGTVVRTMITGTDAGSNLINALLLVLIALAIFVGVLFGIAALASRSKR